MSLNNIGERELIVISKPEVGLRATREGIASVVDVDITPLEIYLSAEGVTIKPLFGISEDRLQYEASSYTAATGIELPDLTYYYKIEAPDEKLDDLAEGLRNLDAVEAAYVKPPTEIPEMLNVMPPAHEEAPPATPDFTTRQGYLDPAPSGVDARYAWTRPGGGGQDVRIIDIEGAWRFTHEDLLQNQGGVVGGTQSTSIKWRNHGTAVVGVIGGDRNNFGITGICPDANVRAISIFGGTGSAGAIRQAADMLSPGDIILIELHRPGPRHNFEQRDDQLGYIAIEWWPDDFDAIKYATNKGVIVVEAAGNGAENLDDSIYNVRPIGFPTSWTNPFNRSNRDSGSIVVGAGAPPPGTHGRNHGPDRSRLSFSNYGSIVDAQGWGREATTCGYGSLQGGSNEDLWYTDTFSGTSSASPIVVGSLGCVQGILRSQGRSPMTPGKARKCLRDTGSPQQDHPTRPKTQRIGNRPNLKEILEPAYTLTVNIVGNGSVSKVPDQATYLGEVVQLTAVAGSGWSFTGWSGDLTGSTNPVTITMDEDKTVTATFSRRCPITMVTLGSMLVPIVQFLRVFRDEIVLKSVFKNHFERLLDSYYRFSPYVVNKMEESSLYKKFLKYFIVYPFVFYAKGAVLSMHAIRGFKELDSTAHTFPNFPP